MDSQHDDRLIEEMLGGAGPPMPDEPVLLGKYSHEEAAVCGASMTPPRSMTGRPNMTLVWTHCCATVLELSWKIEHYGRDVSRDQLSLWRDGVLEACEEMHRALQADPELLDVLRGEAWCIVRERLGEECPSSDPYRSYP